MKTKNYVIYVFLLSLLAAIVDLVTNLIQTQAPFGITASFTFVSFVCWALYFLFGSNLQNGAKGYLSIFSGAVCAILMFALSGAFNMANWYAIPLAVFIVVLIMVPQEKIKVMNLSGVFAGTGLFFAAAGAGALPSFDVKGYAICLVTEMLYALIGLLAGWLTIKLYVFCAGLGEKKAESKTASVK